LCVYGQANADVCGVPGRVHEPALAGLPFGSFRGDRAQASDSIVPPDETCNFRNDPYVVSETLPLIQETGKPAISAEDTAVLKNHESRGRDCPRHGHHGGLKRIVVTVGETIGRVSIQM
jgi:hypothetical protein